MTTKKDKEFPSRVDVNVYPRPEWRFPNVKIGTTYEDSEVGSQPVQEAPDNQTSEADPFDNWPTNQGFDYFYGFIGGETDQFTPALTRGTRAVPVPDTVENGYHFDRDMANDCIDWMRRQKAIAPDRPLFTYWSPGSAHAPHQPPLDWRGRNEGKFDLGWDEYRRHTWERQLEMGIILWEGRARTGRSTG